MAHRSQKNIITSLKSARIDFGLTQQQLAKKTGVPRTTISKIEAGFRNTTVNTILDLAKAVNLDLRLVKQEVLRKTKNMERGFTTLNNVYIDSAAILSNYNFFKNKFKNKDIWPVLKANAYGHGIEPITTILSKVKPTFMVVDSYYEALQIWKISPNQQILLIGALSPHNYPNINFTKISLTVFDISSLKYLGKLNKEVRIHLKVNTGFNRQGIKLDQIEKFCIELKKYPQVKLEGLMSHLANADEPDDKFTKSQEKEFDQVIKLITSHGLKPKHIHLSATAGSFTANDSSSNAIRLGIGLYGYNPLPHNHAQYNKIKIRPALTIASSITNIINIKKGDQVSYNGTYKASKDMKVGVLPLGYFEVFDRKLSNQGVVKFKDTTCPIIGNICMNMTTFDLKNLKAQLYDTVKVISTNPADKNSIYQIAKMTETIPYEVLTRINQNIRRNII
ncbi:MAG: alanine racemase [Candidatus Pacebacteria bacterium]|nr:alanine racemase [Candidatus Paceibacterota bacterium]